MIIDSKKYNGKCRCGREHFMTTELCVIEKGCMSDISYYLKQYGLTGFSVAVYDDNTYKAKGLVRPQCDTEIILPSENLHADEHGVKLLLERLPEKFDFLIAVGSGTVHDITRYCAYEKKVPFVSCPTAASVDGFCSSVAAMTWHGYKKTFTAVAPQIVIADTNVLSQAPFFLTKSGVGDMIGKFISLFEWKMSNALCGEYFCEKIYNMTMAATHSVLESIDDLKFGRESAYEKLIYGLLISGLAMQLLGNSRCASGAEHHISHLIEMEPVGLGVKSTALHGEKVGVGTLIAATEYHRIAEGSFTMNDYKEADSEYIRIMFGERLFESIVEENKNDAAKCITADKFKDKLPVIKQLISEIPDRDKLLNVYRKLGIKETLSDIEVSDDKLDLILEYSPLVRNRLTLMRLRRAMSFGK